MAFEIKDREQYDRIMNWYYGPDKTPNTRRRRSRNTPSTYRLQAELLEFEGVKMGEINDAMTRWVKKYPGGWHEMPTKAEVEAHGG